MAQILFSTHATADTGFGHAARCARLAALLAARRTGLDIALEGEFSDSALSRLAATPAVRFARSPERAGVAVYDRMDDIQDPEVWDTHRLDGLRRRARAVLFMANGTHDPRVPGGVTAIGYKPGGPAPRPPHLLWGLDYAPVAREMLPQAPVPRVYDTALVALGGAHGPQGLWTVLDALSRLPAIRHIDIIDSPVNPLASTLPDLRTGQSHAILCGVPSLTPYLATAGVVIASYGHLGYEALACGAPLCLVGQKAFQVTYAGRLAQLGLCVAAGALAGADPAHLADAIAATVRDAEGFSRAARGAIDGCGLDRIADLILRALDGAAA
ncbi:MAG: hypothetical protein H6842_03270 [Rhodospirillaceae bacterium]|nr:hypothetical protein [Rhodospirillaceae bacterium]